jgi:hypothetical protein
MRRAGQVRSATACALIFVAGVSHAEPWLAPGDPGLRHDLEVLADAGILRGPVTSWPLSWPDIARDVLGTSGDGLDAVTTESLERVRQRARSAAGFGFSGIGLRASASHEPDALRGFTDSPREQGEAAAQASWLTDHVAANLRLTVAADPADDRPVRLDGSYLGVNVGNFMISAGYMERWWGPGWEGSLILSTNARPMPGITLERNYTDPFKNRLLSWIGPWRASIAISQAEEHDVALPKVRFLAARVNFKPRPWMEFGLTRTAQWCGGDRPCGWQTFRDMLIGRDNELVPEGEVDDQPGNQMAGYDLRLRSPWRALPLVFYTQWIGEDEAGGLPSKFLGLFGAETWMGTGIGSLRVRAEYADTTCTFTREQPDFDCAYRNGVYPQGYTYRRRIIGHALDNDSRMTSVGAILVRPRGDTFSAVFRHAEINRNGGFHAISAVPLDLDNVELRYSRAFSFGQLIFSAGLDDRSAGPEAGSDVHGYVTWQQGF